MRELKRELVSWLPLTQLDYEVARMQCTFVIYTKGNIGVGRGGGVWFFEGAEQPQLQLKLMVAADAQSLQKSNTHSSSG